MRLQSKLLLSFGLMLLITFALVEIIGYQQARESMLAELRKNALEIRGILMATRRVYHRQFLNSGIPLNEDTLGFLPAHAMSRISDDFQSWSDSELIFNNVSDRPRNPQNQADEVELEAIAYFRTNPREKERLTPFKNTQGQPYYHFSTPIWVEGYCLKCHGEHNAAPEAIRETYDTAYNYNIGELRGLMSIKLPADSIEQAAFDLRLHEMWGRLAAFVITFIFGAWLLHVLITRRLVKLQSATSALAEGDYTTRLSIQGQDELTDVAIAFNHMVEQRYLSELSVREGEARFRSIFESSVVGMIVVIDEDGIISEWNTGAEQAFGYSADEAVGQPLTMLVPERYREAHIKGMARAIKHGGVLHGGVVHTLSGLRKNGEEFSAELTLGSWKRDKKLYFSAIILDVTERKQAEDVIIYENQLQAVLKSLLSIPLMDRPLHDCLEEALDVVLSAPFAALMPKAGLFLARVDSPILELEIAHNLSEPLLTLCAQVPFGHCLCGLAASKKEVVYSGCVDHSHSIQFEDMLDHGHYNVPILLDGRVLGVMVFYLPAGHKHHKLEVSFLESAAKVFAGIIERKRTEESLLEHMAIAQKANEAKSEFLANMSHELRTPMHAILGFSEMGEKSINTVQKEKLHHYFLRINQSGQRLLLLLNDLLDLSKLEVGGLELELKKHDLEEVVGIVVIEFNELLRKKSLNLIVEPIAVDTVAWIDHDKMVQVVRNLLANAAKFTSEGKTITVSFKDAELPTDQEHADISTVPAISITVADEGVGIPEDELESVFDKFIQSSKTKTNAGGTGLGLAISREIVKRHGGIIKAGNQPQGGATFTVTLPRSAMEEQE